MTTEHPNAAAQSETLHLPLSGAPEDHDALSPTRSELIRRAKEAASGGGGGGTAGEAKHASERGGAAAVATR